MHTKSISLRLPSLIAVLALLATTAHAEAIPEKYIAVERQSCNQACTKDGASAQLCARYCDCSIEKMRAEITYEEYTGVGQSAAKDAPQPPGVLDKLAKIATSCAQATPQ